MENAGQFINFQERQSYAGECVKECSGNITFTWHLAECPDGTGIGCTDVPVATLSGMISTKPKNAMFYSSKPSVYKQNTWYKLTLRGSRSEAVYGETNAQFFVNTPPAGG